MQTIIGDLMNVRVIVMLALFPFLHATSYPVTFVSCKNTEIIVQKDDENVNISLFNLKITEEEGWVQVSKLLENAKDIRIEIDPSSKIEDTIPVYLFVDDILVQEELIKNGYGYPMIHNPEYTYENRLEKAFESTQTMAKPSYSETEKKNAYVAPIYFMVLCSIWLFMLYIIWHNKKKKELQKEKIN